MKQAVTEGQSPRASESLRDATESESRVDGAGTGRRRGVQARARGISGEGMGRAAEPHAHTQCPQHQKTVNTGRGVLYSPQCSGPPSLPVEVPLPPRLFRGKPPTALSQDDPSPAGQVWRVSLHRQAPAGQGVGCPRRLRCAPCFRRKLPAAPTTSQGRTLWPGSPSACSCTSSVPFSPAARCLPSTLRHRGDACLLSFPGFCSGRDAAAPSPARLLPAGTSHAAAWTQASVARMGLRSGPSEHA